MVYVSYLISDEEGVYWVDLAMQLGLLARPIPCAKSQYRVAFCCRDVYRSLALEVVLCEGCCLRLTSVLHQSLRLEALWMGFRGSHQNTPSIFAGHPHVNDRPLCFRRFHALRHTKALLCSVHSVPLTSHRSLLLNPVVLVLADLS